MGWWIKLKDRHGQTCQVPRHERTGIYAGGWPTDAQLYILSGYHAIYAYLPDYTFLDEMLDGKLARDVMPWLENMMCILPDAPRARYWEIDHGNAGHALAVLLKWCRLHPDAILEVT